MPRSPSGKSKMSQLSPMSLKGSFSWSRKNARVAAASDEYKSPCNPLIMVRGLYQTRAMARARFTAELVEGHKGVRAALVPFDPEGVWRIKPHRLAGRRHGWLVKGTLNGGKFDGYVGERWGKFFITLTEGNVGDSVAFVLEPTTSAQTLAKAIEQSKATTQPGKARADTMVRP